MRHFIVRYTIRKGLGPGWEERSQEVAFDDIDPETTDRQLQDFARNEVESRLQQTEDFYWYGRNWTIYSVEEINY